MQRKLKSKMLLQVHDELVFEVPEAEIADMRQLVPEMMVNAIQLSIPLKVDVKTGRNWGEMEK
jgi:DNA polymerase-1